MPTEAPGVRSLQQWMLRVVTHHDGLDSGLLEAAQDSGGPGDGLSVEDIVPPNSRLSSQEQLQIYSFMYFARLIEVLEAEYPNVLFLFGPERFARVARSYLRDHPSGYYNLSRLSAAFPDYLATLDEAAAYPAFASAVARVERAMEDIVDDPGEEPIAFETLAAIPMDNWPQARLRPIRALRLLQLDHPVNDFMNARREEYFAPVPEARDVAMCIHRVGFQVYRQELETEQFLLLSRLNENATLGEAIESVALSPGCDAEKMMSGLAGWFEDWMADNLFASIELD